MRSQTVGVAVCRLPRDFSYVYFMQIEAAVRRNVKKARRLGYEFRRIEYNDYLTDVRARSDAPPMSGKAHCPMSSSTAK